MNRKQFRLCMMVVSMGMGAAIGWSVAVGEYLVPIAVVAIGLVLMQLCKSRVTEVMEDELVYRLSEKASYMTLRVSLLPLAVLGAVFIALSKSGSPVLNEIGLTLAFLVCALLLLHIGFYTYYSRKGVH
ncbi:MAG: DUF2178 domain-containing protein [Methanomicrobia archaeon]|nr:DUF2178 domain-containing protein [Methanomicrobia archaeon]